MPIFWAGLIGALVQAAGTLVGKILISLGVGYVVFTGLDTSLSWLSSQIASSFGSFGGQSMAVLGAMKAGEGVSILVSALSARLLLDGMTSGTIKRLVIK